ncbi:hypothetical protein [Streptomyces mirabilis]|uniref:hypothetical protein n=1 Tax=Streptomyces mirabilis TaxID=68239 RepID=UPI0036B066BF
MSTPAPRSHRRPRVPSPVARGAAPRKPVDWAKVGRSAVRRRARGMTHPEAAAALEEAELQQYLDRDREDLADDERGPAEVGEWARIVQLPAAAGGAYDPDADTFVQNELAAEAAAAEAELADIQMETERQERLHADGLPERAHMLEVLEQARLLGAAGAYGAEGPLVLHEPEDHVALDYVNEYGDWRLHAILGSRNLMPPKDLEAVPASVRAHSALLRAMARTGMLGGFDTGHAVRLAQADPDAVLALAAWIEAHGRSGR